MERISRRRAEKTERRNSGRRQREARDNENRKPGKVSDRQTKVRIFLCTHRSRPNRERDGSELLGSAPPLRVKQLWRDLFFMRFLKRHRKRGKGKEKGRGLNEEMASSLAWAQVNNKQVVRPDKKRTERKGRIKHSVRWWECSVTHPFFHYTSKYRKHFY